MLQTFKFNTGVHIRSGAPLCEGQYWDGNGVKQIPFSCEDVPEGATFKFACNDGNLYPDSGYIVREIKDSTLLSKFAYFQK